LLGTLKRCHFRTFAKSGVFEYISNAEETAFESTLSSIKKDKISQVLIACERFPLGLEIAASENSEAAVSQPKAAALSGSRSRAVKATPNFQILYLSRQIAADPPHL
jgi:hypothetical protein